MNTGDYGGRLYNRIRVVYIVAAALIILAAFLLGMGMWLKALFLALFGSALFITTLAFEPKLENRSSLFFGLSILLGVLALLVLGYGLYSCVFGLFNQWIA